MLKTETTPETTTETFIERVDIDDDEATAQTRALGEFLTEPRKGLFAVDVELLDEVHAFIRMGVRLEYLEEPCQDASQFFPIDRLQFDRLQSLTGVDATDPRYKNALLYTVKRVSEDGFVREVRELLARVGSFSRRERGLWGSVQPKHRPWPDAALRYIYAALRDSAGENIFDISSILDEFQFFPTMERLREFCDDEFFIDDDVWKKRELLELIDDGSHWNPETSEHTFQYWHGCFLARVGGGFLVQAEPDDDKTFASEFSGHAKTRCNSVEAVATRAALRLKSPSMTGLYPASFETYSVWGSI